MELIIAESKMIRHVFDEPNPFGPELKRKKKSQEAIAAQQRASTSQVRTPKSRVIPPEQRVKTRLHAVDAYTRHKMMINNYVAYYRGSTQKLQRDTTNDKNDFDIIRENHRFLWSDSDLTDAEQSWEAGLAKRYYEKLFKEYCIVDLSQCKRNLYAMRWRTEAEVFAGKGQFECGNKHCQSKEALSSWEVNFGYTEHEVRKNALVKVRLCPDCSQKLNFHSQKRLIKKVLKKMVKKEENAGEAESSSGKRRRHEKKEKRRRRKKNRGSSSSSSSSSGTSSESDEEKRRQKGDGTDEGDEKKLSAEEKGKIDQQIAAEKAAAKSAADIWAKKTAVLDAEKSVTDEFDEFIDDLLL